MKIAYINLLQTKIIGVNQKLDFVARAMKLNGLNIDVIVLNTEINQLINNVNYIKLPANNFFDTMERKFYRYHQFEKKINLDSYDKIILRWSGLDLSVPRFLDRYGHKVISEHHANELIQFKRNIGSVSTFFSYLLTKLMYRRFLRGVSGIIGVTNEITNSHKLRETIPTFTMTNGIDVDSINFTKFVPFNGRALTIAFMASSYSKWHGIDRFLKGLKNYKGDVHVNLIIIGKFSEIDKKKIKNFQKPNIKIDFKGIRLGKHLDDILMNSNLAVSTLAFFRVGIRDGCPIKSREYMARGLPFIYSYDDEDIDGQDGFALKLPADESAIEILEVIEFAKKVSADFVNVSKRMRDYSRENLDWNKKIIKLNDFLMETLS